MAERTKKISELTALTNVSGDDLLLIVDQPGTANAETKRVTAANFFANVSTNTVFKQTLTANTVYLSNTTNTPSSSSDTGVKGEVRIDSSYIYVCTATNTWKRAAISSW